MSLISWYRRKRQFGVLFWVSFISIAVLAYQNLTMMAAEPSPLQGVVFIFTKDGISSYTLATIHLPEIERIALESERVKEIKAQSEVGSLEVELTGPSEGFEIEQILTLWNQMQFYANRHSLRVSLSVPNRKVDQGGEIQNIQSALNGIASDGMQLRFALSFPESVHQEIAGIRSLIYALQGNPGVVQYQITGIPQQEYLVELKKPGFQSDRDLLQELHQYAAITDSISRGVKPLSVFSRSEARVPIPVFTRSSGNLLDSIHSWLGNQAVEGYSIAPATAKESASIVLVNGREALLVDCSIFQNSGSLSRVQELLGLLRTPEVLGFSKQTQALILQNPIVQKNSFFSVYFVQLGIGLALLSLFLMFYFRSLRIMLLFWSSLLIALGAVVVIYYVLGIPFTLLSLGMVVLSLGIVIDATLVYQGRLGESLKSHQNKAISRSAEDIFSSILTNTVVFLPLFFVIGSGQYLSQEIGLAFIIANLAGAFSALLFMPFALSISQPRSLTPVMRFTPFSLKPFHAARGILFGFAVLFVTALLGLLLLPGNISQGTSEHTLGQVQPRIQFLASKPLTFNDTSSFLSSIDAQLSRTPLSRRSIERIAEMREANGSITFYGLHLDPSETAGWHQELGSLLAPLAEVFGITLDFSKFGSSQSSLEVSSVGKSTDWKHMSTSGTTPLKVTLGGPTLETLISEAQRFLTVMKNHRGIRSGGFSRSNSGNISDSNTLSFWLDHEYLWNNHIEPMQISQALSNVSARSLPIIPENTIEPIYTIAESPVVLSSDFSQAMDSVKTPEQGFPLSKTMHLIPAETFFNTPITRRNQQYIVDLSFTLNPQILSIRAALGVTENLFDSINPAPGIQLLYDDIEVDRGDQAFPLWILGFSALVILCILIGHFESIRFGVLCFLTIPLSLGVSLSIIIITLGLSVGSGMGMLILTGLVVNDAILFISQLRDYPAKLLRGWYSPPAVLLSARRRAPQMISTSITTILSIIPGLIAQSLTPISFFWIQLGATLIIGMVVSTLFSLFVLPAILIVLGERAGRASCPPARSIRPA